MCGTVPEFCGDAEGSHDFRNEIWTRDLPKTKQEC
jgi:hypothetical protein